MLFAAGHLVEIKLDAEIALGAHFDGDEVSPAAPMS